MIQRLSRGLEVLLGSLTAIAFAVLIGAVLLQVASRLFLPRAPVWTEELSRFCLLYMVALAAGLALRTGDLVNVDIVTAALPAKARRVLEAVVMVGIVGFGALLVQPALQFVRIGGFQTSPALGWSMTFIHLIVLIAPVTLILFALQRLLVLLRPSAEG